MEKKRYQNKHSESTRGMWDEIQAKQTKHQRGEGKR
jgi:hypothetical protein